MKQRSVIRNLEIYTVLALLVVITIFLGISVSNQVSVATSGSLHPEITGMKIGGEGAMRIKGIEAVSFAMFAALFILMSVLIATGISKRYRTLMFWIGLGCITLIILFVWYRVFHSYMIFLTTGELIYYLGFPEPTAWMIFGLWGGGALFTLLYVIGFRKFVFTDEDEETLRKIVEEYSKQKEED